MSVEPLLRVEDLRVAFHTEQGDVAAVDGVSFELAAGEVLAIVGVSGSGKSVTAMTLVGLTRAANSSMSGSARFRGADLLDADEAALRRVRGAEIALVFQDPASALNPVHRIGAQIAEQIRAHLPLSREEALERAVAVLERVGFPQASERARSFPHELSGGMRQRAMLAMALSCDPSVLIADEPTSALDVTTQAQILGELAALRDETETGIVLISHDLGVVATLADRIAVMHAGQLVETGTAEALFDAPQHPRTRALLDAAARPSRPRPARPVASAGTTPELEVEQLERSFPVRSSGPLGREVARLRAVDGVSFSLHAGETLGLVGESGCGKTTLARTTLRLLDATDGRVRWRGEDVTDLRPRALRARRAGLGMVFQDAAAALNPRRDVASILAAPLALHGVKGAAAGARVRELLDLVGLEPAHLTRFPHELSGGQRQRVGIARALAPEPATIVLDEPVSALDAVTRTQILDLLADLQARFGLAYLLISHDLAVVRSMSDRVAVMYLGKLVEIGAAEALDRPIHPYTSALLAAVPIADPRAARARPRVVIEGEPPSPAAAPAGCAFHPRCSRATEVCETVVPQLRVHADGHVAACHHPLAAGTLASDDEPR